MSDQAEPLDKQFRTVLNKKSNQNEQVPAIDRVFKQEYDFVTFKAAPNFISSSLSHADEEEYVERLEMVLDDLRWLLALPYQKFWCQMIYDPKASRLIDSYLKLGPRPYDMLDVILPAKVNDLLRQIHKYVFLVCCRCSTNKESKENFMTKEAFSRFIYDNYIFDVPRILDLCVLYQNNPLLNKMVEHLFTSQNKFYTDFKKCIPDMIKAIETNTRKLRELFALDSVLCDVSYQKLDQVVEVVYYLKDFLLTLNSALSTHPKLAEFFLDNKFEKSLRSLTEGTLFDVKKAAKKLSASDVLIHSVNCVIYQSAKFLNLLIDECCVRPFVNDALHEYQPHAAQNFYKLCSDLIENKRLVAYFQRHFNLLGQLRLIYEKGSASGRIDVSQFKYLLETLKSCVKESSSVLVEQRQEETQAAAKVEPILKEEASRNPIKDILELFPNLDQEFIKGQLFKFNNDAEKLINHLLENSVGNVNEEEPKETFQESSSRRNVFENDEFDIFHNEKIDLSKVSMGKKNKLNDFNDHDVKHFYEVNQKFKYEYEYEDEYDDTYDSNLAPGRSEHEPEMSFKPLNQKLESKKRDEFFADDAEEEEVEEDEKKSSVSNKPQSSAASSRTFVPFAKQQQHQHQPHQPNQHVRRDWPKKDSTQAGNEARRGEETNPRDGNASRGDDVKRERKWKTENKAKQAHHNRKEMSMRKNKLF